MPSTPISVDLSRLLLAFTIELDSEFERRMAAALPKRPFRVSAVMWSNFLRFVESGIAVGELPAACGLPQSRVLSTLGGMERWGYVSVDSCRTRPERRDGFGSARGLKADWLVRPTVVGATAQEIWPTLFAEIEERWSARSGNREVAKLLGACSALGDGHLPELTTEGVDVRDVPAAAAVSREAISMALTYLARQGLAEGTKIVRLTEDGLAARERTRATHARVARAWTAQHGRPSLERLRSATQAILGQRDGSHSRLAVGLEPHPEGWRASGRYLAQTKRMLADPCTGLPRHPMVLHRGGWPDGS